MLLHVAKFLRHVLKEISHAERWQGCFSDQDSVVVVGWRRRWRLLGGLDGLRVLGPLEVGGGQGHGLKSGRVVEVVLHEGAGKWL